MRKKKQRMSNSARSRQRAFHMMLFLPVLLLFIFNYLPIFGLVMAFQDFQPGLGFLKSKWVGFDNFRTIYYLPDFLPALRNTLMIALGKIIGNIAVPLTFALMLNEIKNKLFKKTVQTATYLPYFLSWIVLSGILINFLSQGNTKSDTGLF